MSRASVGRALGALCGGGNLHGGLIWGGAVALGLGAILKTLPTAYTIVKFVRTTHLVWVGFNLIRHSRRAMEEDAARLSRNNPMQAFKRGLLTNLLNPKIGVFYVRFLPQFIPAHANVAADSFRLAVIHVGPTLVWFTVLIAAAPLSRALRQPRTISLLDRVASGVFILFWLKPAFSRA